MFLILQYVMLFITACCGITASVSDRDTGLIPNRMLLAFAAVGTVGNILLYGWIARDLFFLYILNLLLCSLVSLTLFYCHEWAGGDAKLFITMAYLYPASCLIAYGSFSGTLFLSVIFAFLYGYLYILFLFVKGIADHSVSLPDKSSMKHSLLAAAFSYIRMFVYLTLIMLAVQWLLPVYFQIPAALQFAIMYLIARGLRKCRVLERKPVVIGAAVLLAVLLLLIPGARSAVSVSHLLFCLAVILLQIQVRPVSYQTVPTSEVKKGMILSAASSLQFMKSRVQGLPPLSDESLGSRITEEQAASIRRWETSKYGQPTIEIVRKVPFGIFILLGFVTYFLLWRFLL